MSQDSVQADFAIAQAALEVGRRLSDHHRADVLHRCVLHVPEQEHRGYGYQHERYSRADAHRQTLWLHHRLPSGHGVHVHLPCGRDGRACAI